VDLQIDPISITDLERIQKKLAQLPKAVGDAGVEQGSNYLIGVLVNKEMPPYQYVSRKAAYGQTFQSDKQRRWFWWAVKTGKILFPIHYVRRSPAGGLAAAWKILGSGQARTLTNTEPSAVWVYSQRQAKQLALVGWKKITVILKQYEKNIYDSFMRGAKKAIRDLGLQ
jgi:hypothetical protein